MSTGKVSVIFQGKASGGIQCNAGMVLLHSSEMKSLKARIGSIVAVETPTISLLCQAWPSKKAVAGTITLNKMYSSNFPDDQRKARLVQLSSKCRIVKASSASFENIGESKNIDNSTFRDLLRMLFGSGPIMTGLQISLSYNCEPISLQVVGCETVDVALSGDYLNYYYQLHSDTKIIITKPKQTNNNDDNRLHNEPAFRAYDNDYDDYDDCDASICGLPKLLKRVSKAFSGYEAEVIEALKVASFGLGVQHLLSPVSSTVSPHGDNFGQPTSSRVGYNTNDLMRAPKGLLLHGPPGTGKTTLMHAIVRALNCNYIELSHSLLLSRYEGDAEKMVTKVFREASVRSPCCILIDNIDQLCYSRSAAGASELQKRVVACLLTLMDGVSTTDSNSSGRKSSNVFIIGTSVRTGDIDSAVRRAGRIDREIEIGVPSSVDRECILTGLLENSGVHVISGSGGCANDNKNSLAESDVRQVAQQAHGMVGSDLLSVIKEAFYLTLRGKDPLFLTASASTTAQLPVHKVAGETGIDTLKELEKDSVSLSLANLADEFAALDVADDDDTTPLSSTGITIATPGTTAAIVNSNSNTATATAGISKNYRSKNSIDSTTVSNSLVTTATDPGRGLDMGGQLITTAALRCALTRISPSALREVVIEVPSVHWADIGGMEGVKQSLKEVVEWPLQRPELFASLGISPPKGVLLYGPPGCSKTLMAKALATESAMNFLAVRGPELLSKWLGESEKAVQALFRRARAAAPSIVFFDEIDALAGKRGDVSSGVSDRVLSQLLTELDGVHGLKQVIVIAATNRPDMLDAALIRPGRIDRKIYVPPPDEESRRQILELELKKMPQLGDFDYDILVNLTAGFSGAEIVGACAEAAMLAIEAKEQHLRFEHISSAVKCVKPQITQEMLEFYRSCTDKL